MLDAAHTRQACRVRSASSCRGDAIDLWSAPSNLHTGEQSIDCTAEQLLKLQAPKSLDTGIKQWLCDAGGVWCASHISSLLKTNSRHIKHNVIKSHRRGQATKTSRQAFVMTISTIFRIFTCIKASLLTLLDLDSKTFPQMPHFDAWLLPACKQRWLAWRKSSILHRVEAGKGAVSLFIFNTLHLKRFRWIGPSWVVCVFSCFTWIGLPTVLESFSFKIWHQ